MQSISSSPARHVEAEPEDVPVPDTALLQSVPCSPARFRPEASSLDPSFNSGAEAAIAAVEAINRLVEEIPDHTIRGNPEVGAIAGIAMLAGEAVAAFVGGPPAESAP